MRWLLQILPDQSPDFAFVAGQAWQGDPRFRGAANHIPAHSFDYRVYRARRAAVDDTAARYAVLDETIAGHGTTPELGFLSLLPNGIFTLRYADFSTPSEATTGCRWSSRPTSGRYGFLLCIFWRTEGAEGADGGTRSRCQPRFRARLHCHFVHAVPSMAQTARLPDQRRNQ